MADSTTGATPGTGVLLQGVTNASAVALANVEVDQFGNPFGFNALRDKLVAQRYTVLPDSIANGIASFWVSTVANGGAVTVTSGEGLVQTSANANGSAQIVSTAPPYHPGQVHWLNSAARFGDAGVAANVRRIGAFTVNGAGVPQDGFAYELNGTTFNAVAYKGGVATAVAAGSWTQFAAYPFTLDTAYHQFEIRYTSNSVHFLIDNVLRHSASGGSTSITNTLDFPMVTQSINTASAATNQVIAVRNIGLGRFGEPPANALSPNVTMQNAAGATGNGVTLNTIAYGAAVVQITGTFSATITFEGTLDGTNYVAIPATLLSTMAIATTATVPGIYRLAVAGLNNIRARISVWVSGAVTAVGLTTNAPVEAEVIQLAAGAAEIGRVRITDGTNLGAIKAASTAAVAADTSQVVALHPTSPLPAGANAIGTVAAPAITKGTQGATGFTTQDLKDAGRVIFSASTVIAGVTAVTAEALLSLVPTRDGVAAAGATTQAVTANKRLRVTGIIVGIRNTGAAIISARVTLRMNPGGAVAATSPILAIIPLSSGVATAEAGEEMYLPFPDGIEFSGTHQFGLTQVANAIGASVYASIIGHEY